MQCALAKLSYLLGHQLDVKTIRELMGQSLRGELTPPTPPIPTGDGSHARILSMLDSLLLRNEPFSPTPTRELPSSLPAPPIADSDALTAERALYPVLLSAAAARSDDTLGNLLAILSESSTALLPLLNTATPVCQPPLHVSAAAGLAPNVVRLLKLGASVHLRDANDRSALFHAARGGCVAIRTYPADDAGIWRSCGCYGTSERTWQTRSNGRPSMLAISIPRRWGRGPLRVWRSGAVLWRARRGGHATALGTDTV